jgi:hypothetical protein
MDDGSSEPVRQQFLIFEPEDQPNVFAAPEPEYRNLRSGWIPVN